MRPGFFLFFLSISLLTGIHTAAQADRTPPALAAIKEADLQRDIGLLAGDHFRGREAGTLDELKVAVWWADILKAEGLKQCIRSGRH